MEDESLNDCLKLLRGPSDEQRLAGVLLATKFVSAGDSAATLQVFEAIGFDFVDRLLSSQPSDESGSHSQGFRNLGVSLLSAFCRVSELAQNENIVGKVPMLVDALRHGPTDGSLDIYECLYGIALSSERGLKALREENVLGLLATSIKQLASGDSSSNGTDLTSENPSLSRAMKLLLVLFKSGVEDTEIYEHAASLAAIVPFLSHLLANRSDDLKFESLSLLTGMLTPDSASECIWRKLKESPTQENWADHIRTGLGHILHSKTAVEHRQLSLQLARAVAAAEGDSWLLGPITSPVDKTPLPNSRFFLLLLQSSRVEVALLLDRLARENFTEASRDLLPEADPEPPRGLGLQRGPSLKDVVLDLNPKPLLAGGGGGLSRGGSMNLAAMDFDLVDLANEEAAAGREAEAEPPGLSPEIVRVQRVVGECFGLLESLIGVLAEEGGEGEGEGGEEGAMACALDAEVVLRSVEVVDEALGVTLEYLEKAQEFGRRQDCTALACVRVIGRFLAEAPQVYRRRVLKLLPFMLSVKTEEEEMPVQSVRLLLPALLQLTCEPRVCRLLVKEGAQKHLVGFAQEQSRTSVMGSLRAGETGHLGLTMVCNVLLNILGSREEHRQELDPQDFVRLFASAVSWRNANDASGKEAVLNHALAACLSASVMELASEDAVKTRLDLASHKRLPKAMEVIVEFLEIGNKMGQKMDMFEGVKTQWDIIVAACVDSLPKWPLLKRAVEKSSWWIRLNKRPLTREVIQQRIKDPLLQHFMASVAML